MVIGEVLRRNAEGSGDTAAWIDIRQHSKRILQDVLTDQGIDLTAHPVAVTISHILFLMVTIVLANDLGEIVNGNEEVQRLEHKFDVYIAGAAKARQEEGPGMVDGKGFRGRGESSGLTQT